ncbi:MAG: hypothetical protein HWQ42_01870 [Nostoc sp. JL23]|uniref:DUF6464 family protein n=1 Tax=uncultured Nostoc sp. TaxID=340711 RepID=UPI001DB9A8AF|nr:hypothetical protein [Nostoc sp. JL23]
MNQIESIFEFLPNCRLHLWTDATDEIDAHDIKQFIKTVVEQFDLRFVVSTYFYQECQHWTIRFKWRGSSMVHGVEHLIRVEDLERYRRGELPYFVVTEICDRIRRLMAPDDSQNWVIVRWREEHFAKIHQAGKRSVNLILHEVMQEGDLTSNHTTVTIRARIQSDAIRRGDSVEIGGMLLQGELLGWVEDNQQGWFLFSPNTHQVNMSGSSPDEIRITFTTHPGTTRPNSMRLAAAQTLGISMEDMVQMSEFGREYFYCFLESPPYSERITPSTERRWQGCDADSEYEGLGLRTCKYNARSRMIRCAVNPDGPCQGCKDYEKI